MKTQEKGFNIVLMESDNLTPAPHDAGMEQPHEDLDMQESNRITGIPGVGGNPATDFCPPPWSRRKFLTWVPALAAATLISPWAHAVETQSISGKKPNILFILVDDAGVADLSCLGSTDARTPNLDALAARGVRFNRCYANSALCAPSRAALMTGRYPSLARLRGNTGPNAPYFTQGSVALPAALKTAGYHTGAIGKWHLGETSPNTPNEVGFDEFYGLRGPMLKSYTNHARVKGSTNSGLWRNDQPITPEGHATDLFADEASAFLRRRAQTPEPFFLYLAFNAPHSPIEPKADWRDRVSTRLPKASPYRQNYLALWEHADDAIGRVLAVLRETGLADNTLVLFASDNGPKKNAGSSAPLRGGKGSLFEGGIRVPGLAAWPGHIPAGGTCDEVVLLMDFYPTICTAAGAPLSSTVDGVNLLPALTGKGSGPGERLLFWSVPVPEINPETRKKTGKSWTEWATRRGDWKLIQPKPDSSDLLFNLAVDPLEKTSVAERSTIRKELEDALLSHIKRAETIAGPLTGTDDEE